MNGNDFVYLHLSRNEMSNIIHYKEGEKLNFTIKKQIDLSENENYFVLQDINKRKQLLSSKLYKKYNFIVGQNIICRIDHINCAGKIFIEPEHPYYKEGKSYNFIIDKIKPIKNRLGEDILQIIFIDEIENEAYCKIENANINDYRVGEMLSCKVELIKKATLYLTHTNSDNTFDLKIDKYYNFKIVDVKTLADNFKYYVLLDEMQNTHLLRYEYYDNHDFEIGKLIECKLLKFSSEGYYILEPKHPFYEIGKEYEFDFVEEKEDERNELTNNYEITVKDIFNKEVMFTSNKSIGTDNVLRNKIRCKVIGIKKGKALLSLI